MSIVDGMKHLTRKTIICIASLMILCFASRVNAEWHTTSFGGIVTVQATPTWHSTSFGGTVTVQGNPTWSNWSSSWKIGQTSVYDISTTLDLKVNAADLSALASHYMESGDPGWIRADINDNGGVGPEDLSALASHYMEDYT